MRSKIYKSLMYIIPLLAIMVLVLWYKEQNYYPKIFGDEYGYWAAGAFFAGLDWNDITVLNDYYGWGYGIILGLLLRLPVSIKTSYIMAIALNGVFLWLVYCIYYKLIHDLFPRKSKAFSCILAFTCTILPTSLFYTQFTMSETILELVYSLLLLTYWSMLKKNTVVKMLFIALLDCIMISIHLRTLGIVAVSVVTVFIICLKSKKKDIMLFSMFVVVLVTVAIGVIGIKKYYLDGVSLGFIQMSNVNTASGQAGKIAFLITRDGLKSFIFNMIGRVYSLCVNSFMLAFIAVLFGIIECIKGLKNKDVPSTVWFTVICVLNSISLVTISALFMIGGTYARFDILTYSRYHEFANGALMILGVYWLDRCSKHRNSNWVVLFSGIFILCLTKVVGKIMDYNTSTSSLFLQNPIVYFSFWKSPSDVDLYISLTLVALAIFILLFVLLKYNKPMLVNIVLICMAVSGVYVANYVYKAGCLSWSKQYFDETDGMVSFINANGYQQSLCFLADDDVLRVDLLRFAMKDDSIIVVDGEQLEDIMGDGYILVSTNNYSGEADLEDYEVAFSANDLYLWRVSVSE